MATDDARAEEGVSTTKEEIQIAICDREAVAAGVIESAGRCVALLRQLEAAQKENVMLLRVLEVLEDAPEDIPAKAEGPAGAEAEVGRADCQGRYTEAEVEEILEPLPDAQAQPSEDSGLHEESDINSGSGEDFHGGPDTSEDLWESEGGGQTPHYDNVQDRND